MRHSRRQKSSAAVLLAPHQTENLLGASRSLSRPQASPEMDRRPPRAVASGLALAEPSPARRPLAVTLYCGALDSVRDAVVILERNGMIAFRNGAAACLLDISAQPRPESIRDLPCEPWKTACRLLGAFGGTQPLEQEEQVRDGQMDKSWLLSLRELPRIYGEEPYFVLVLRDVSAQEQNQQDARLREALARSGALLASAAHQAKNVLFTLSATLEAFSAKCPSQEASDAEPYLHYLRDGLVRMQSIVRGLFDCARPSGMQNEVFSAAAAIRHAANSCREVASARSVRVSLDLNVEALLRGDAAPLTRAFENVIDNAVRHSPENQHVQVRLEFDPERTGWLQCTVADAGPGFSQEEFRQAFTPFFSRRPGGAGLGLTIARMVIENHGGQIHIANRPIGGAMVTICLPAACAADGGFHPTTQPGREN